jgi:arsenite oxidase small subunit
LAEQSISRRRFIRIGAALGAGAAGASLISACSSSGSSGSSGSGEKTTAGAVQGASQAGGDTTVAQVQSGAVIAQESDVPTGSAIEFTDEENGQPAVLVHLQSGDFAAYSAVCTHRQCTVGYKASEGELACPCHGSVFDPENDGAVVNGPAAKPLPKIPVRTQNGEIVRA